MKSVVILLIGLVVALSVTAAQWFQAQRLRRSKPARRGAFRQFAG